MKVLICDFVKNIIRYKIKILMNNIDIKLLAKNFIFENIKKCPLNNIAKLLYKIIEFIRFLLKTTNNIIVNSSNANLLYLNKIYDNLLINPAV